MMNAKLIQTAVFCLLSLSVSTAGAADSDEIELGYRLQKGHTYKLRVTTEQTTVQQVGDKKKLETSQVLSVSYVCKLRDVNEQGTATIEVAFGPITVEMKDPTGELNYNSEDPPAIAPGPAKQYAAMAGGHFTMRMRRDGTVIDITDADKLTSAMLRSLAECLGESLEDAPGEPIGDGDEGIGKFLDPLAAKRSLVHMIMPTTRVYPGKPVRVGDSWTVKLWQLVLVYGLTFENTWTLAERKNGLATIELESTIHLVTPRREDVEPPPADLLPAEGVIVPVDPLPEDDLAGTQEGTLKVDEATGWPIEGKLTQEINGGVAGRIGLLRPPDPPNWPPGGPPDGPVPLELLPTTITINVTVEGNIEDAPAAD